MIDGDILSYNTTNSSSQQAEKLFSLIDESLKESKLKLADIDIISVTNGPGSFTGVRIGLAAALGMKAAEKAKFIKLHAEPASGRGFEGDSERKTGVYKRVREDLSTELTHKSSAEVGLCKKFIAISNFQVLAFHARDDKFYEKYSVVLDARREQVYLQEFSNNLIPIAEAKLVDIENFQFDSEAYFIGDGVPLINFANKIEQKNLIVDAKLLAAATEFYWKNQQYHDLVPLYIRQPDVTVKK